MKEELKKISNIEDISKALKTIENAIINGDTDALEVFVSTSRAEKLFKSFNSTIKGYAKDEAFKYEGKTFGAFGAEITLKNGSARPNYDDDEVYCALKKSLKQREELLKTALKSSDPIFDKDGVEVTKVSVKYTDDSLIIK